MGSHRGTICRWQFPRTPECVSFGETVSALVNHFTRADQRGRVKRPHLGHINGGERMQTLFRINPGVGSDSAGGPAGCFADAGQ